MAHNQINFNEIITKINQTQFGSTNNSNKQSKIIIYTRICILWKFRHNIQLKYNLIPINFKKKFFNRYDKIGTEKIPISQHSIAI